MEIEKNTLVGGIVGGSIVAILFILSGTGGIGYFSVDDNLPYEKFSLTTNGDFESTELISVNEGFCYLSDVYVSDVEASDDSDWSSSVSVNEENMWTLSIDNSGSDFSVSASAICVKTDIV